MTRNTNPNDQIIAANLARIRQFRQLSQPGLADLLGISCAQIQKYETATNRVALSRAIDICAALQCSLDQLCLGTCPTPTNTQRDLD